MNIAITIAAAGLGGVFLSKTLLNPKSKTSPSLIFSIGYALVNSPLGYYYHRYFLYESKPSVVPNHPATSSKWIVRDQNIGHCGVFQIRPVPYGDSNIAYIIIDTETDDAVVVDPGDSKTVLDTLFEIYPSANLLAILTTHHHWDHSGGNAYIVHHSGNEVDVYGSKTEFSGTTYRNLINWYTKVNKFVEDGDSFSIGRMKFTAIQSDFHTIGGLMYLFESNTPEPEQPSPSQSLSPEIKQFKRIEGDSRPETPEIYSEDDMLIVDPPSPQQEYIEPPKQTSQPPQSQKPASCLFTGDHLFICGCGAFFEGSAHSFHKLVKIQIPKYMAEGKITGDTLFWPGHEYSYTNVSFASELEKGNFDIQMKLKDMKDLKYIKTLSCPSTLESELLTNPFLRIDAKHSNAPKSKRPPPPGVMGGMVKASRQELWKSVVEKSVEFESEVRERVKKHYNGEQEDEVVALACLRVLKDRYKVAP